MKGGSLLLPAWVLFVCGCAASSGPPSADTTPPATIQDLAAVGAPGRRVDLTWTAPSHDGAEGRASRYDVRYSAARLTEENWAPATVLANPPAPKVAGQRESLDVAGI